MQLLAGVVVLLADAVAVDDDELAVGGDGEPCDLRELLRRYRHRLDSAVTLVVPHRLAQLFLLFGRGKVAAFLLQLRQQLVEDASSMIRLPSAEHPEPKSDVLDSRVLRAASAMSAVSSMIIVELPEPTP